MKIFKDYKIGFLLLAILVLASFLRIYQISLNPPALNWDEVSHGYNAYSILKTGQDEWGNKLPLIFRAYGDYKLPFYIYTTSLSISVFGLNEFAVRFPSALAGILAVFFTYLLVRKITKNEWLGLLSSLLLAISPWHIFLSRPAFEANLASFLIIGGFYFFLVGLNKKWFLPLSLLLFGLSLHTYNSARVMVSLFLLVLIILYKKEIKKIFKNSLAPLIVSLIIFLFLFIPFFNSFISKEGQARFGWVSIIDQGAINRINDNRTNSNLPSFLPVLTHNKATYFTFYFTRNFFSNLSPDYLFFKGGSNYQYNLQNKGIIYPIQIPFILLGFFFLLKNFKKKEYKALLFWWILAIIPSAATRDNPHVLRTILVLPIPQIISALGFFQLIKWVKKKKFVLKLTTLYLLILFFFLFSFAKTYFTDYKKDYSWSWQYGYKQVAELIKDEYDNYDKFFITKKYGEPHEFLLFYLGWDPEKYRNDPYLVRYLKDDWYWVDSFDKFVFINDWEIKERIEVEKDALSGKYLLITSPGNYPEGLDQIKTINFLDNKPAFEILKW